MKENMDRYRLWTPAEDAILRQYYPIEGSAAHKRIPGRTKAACRDRVANLGLYFTGDYRLIRHRKPSKNMWTSEEQGVLREFYPIEGLKVSARLPGRTPGACRVRANTLKIAGPAVHWKKRRVE